MQKKILKLEQNAIDYYDFAVDKADEEDYLTSLYYLRKSIKADPTMLDNYFLLAEIYYEMGLYEHSNNQYFKLLPYGVNTSECYLRIAQNFICMGNVATAKNYLKQSISNSLDGDEIEEATDILDYIETDRGGLRVISPDIDHRKTLDECRELIGDGHFQDALDKLNKIPSGSALYVEALNNMAVCYACLNRQKESLDVCLEAYRLEPNNVFTLCNLISSYTFIRDEKALAEICKKLDRVAVSEPADIFKVALANLECNRIDAAIKALDKYLEIIPYNEVAILLKGLALHNKGNVLASKKCMVDLITIDDSNTVAKYYNKLMSAPDYKPETLDYSQNVPITETFERLRLLAEFSGLSNSAARTAFEKNQNDIVNLIKWSFKVPNLEIQRSVIKKLGICGSETAEDFLQETLLDTATNDIIKQLALSELIKIDSTQTVLMLSDDRVKEIKFRTPRAVMTSTVCFFEAFSDVYAALCVYAGEGFESQLNAVAKNILSALGDRVNSMRSKSALSALIAYTYEDLKIFSDVEYVCLLFGAAKSTFKKYLSMLKNNVN